MADWQTTKNSPDRSLFKDAWPRCSLSDGLTIDGVELARSKRTFSEQSAVESGASLELALSALFKVLHWHRAASERSAGRQQPAVGNQSSAD